MMIPLDWDWQHVRFRCLCEFVCLITTCLIESLIYHQGISFDTRTGFAPYKVLYLLCGAMAITVGIAVLIWMPDSPLHARFLSQEERIVAVERVRDDQGGTENKRLKKEQLRETLLDVRTWLIVLSTLISAFKFAITTNEVNAVFS